MPKNDNSKKLDKFYTNQTTAQYLIGRASEFMGIDIANSPTIEPSAGSGAFSSKLADCLAYDIEPDNCNIAKQDFLDENFTILDSNNRIAIGNPPFGKKGKLAIQFLNKCGKMCKAVCFILPSTFRRWSVQSKVDSSFRLILDEDLKTDVDSFEFDGKPFSLNCIFQIWTKDENIRADVGNLRMKEKPPISHSDFSLWQYNGEESSKKYLYEDWHVATYRQGYKDYSKIFSRKSDFDEVKNIVENTKIQLMFIRFNNKKAVDIFFNKMDLTKLAKKNLSTPGFGKADFISEYNELCFSYN